MLVTLFIYFRVFQSKENDVADGELDAQLSTFSGTGESLKIWVGKDYTNFINKDFVELDKPFTGGFYSFLYNL